MKIRLLMILTALLMLGGIDAKAQYYWYVGTTEPTAASNPATDPGWTKLDSKPDEIDIWTEDPDWNDVQWYIAAPAEFHFDTTVNGSHVGGWEKTQVIINGVLYDVWTSLVLKDTVSVTLANVGGSTDPTYYWYVGNTEPTEASNPATDSGWTELSSKPNQIVVFAEDPDWNDVQWYMAAPAEWNFNTTFNGVYVGGWIYSTVQINGIEYSVWKGGVLTDAVNVTLANVGGSTNPTYYWYAGPDMLTKSTVPGSDANWHEISGTPTSIETGDLANETKINWVLAVPSALGLTRISNGEDVTDFYEVSKVIYDNGVEYVVFRQVRATKRIDVSIVQGPAIETYFLIYKVDDKRYKAYELAEGTIIIPEPEPTKDGYEFSGWSEIPSTMPAEDVTITGTFSLPATDDVITLKDTGKGTWCSDYDLDFTDVEGIKAYTATGYDDVDKTIWLTRVFKVPAGTGIMVKGDPGEHKIPHANVKAVYASFFKGVTGAAVTINETDGDNTNYYMDGGQFKRVNGSATISPNRAYLQLPTLVFAGTRSIDVIYEDEIDDKTGIHSAAITSGQEPGIYYNLQGQRVDIPKKGLYIKNGKKVVIK